MGHDLGTGGLNLLPHTEQVDPKSGTQDACDKVQETRLEREAEARSHLLGAGGVEGVREGFSPGRVEGGEPREG